MNSESENKPDVDWSLATWEGARREAMRRWSELPLENIIAAQEEMAEIAELFSSAPEAGTRVPPGPDD